MDPITHALVGAAVGVFVGADVSLTSPEMLAVSIGAVLPDIDILYQCWGDYIYLKKHRGFSHSLLGLVILAGFLGGLMFLIYPGTTWESLFLWALLGGVSHSFLDLLNSYGVMLFYPFNHRKYTLNLLMITDPFLIIISLVTLYLGYKKYSWLGSLVCLFIYLTIRYLMRKKAERRIRKIYSKYLCELVVMPAFFGLIKWDFIVQVKGKNIVGQINIINNKIKIHKKLKLIGKEIQETLEKTKIGFLFKEFTPFCHIDYSEEGNKLIGNFTDMRYFVKNRFLHHGTVILDKKEHKVLKALFQPYDPNNKIEII